jgi:hypothetical protein
MIKVTLRPMFIFDQAFPIFPPPTWCYWCASGMSLFITRGSVPQQVTLRQLILIEIVARFDHPIHSFRSAILILSQTDSMKAVGLFGRLIQWHLVSS